MKNFTTKKFIGIAAIAFGLSVFSATGLALASGGSFFNGDPNDLDTVKVSNVTQNPGSSQNWYNNISANGGDIVAVRVSYHNTGPDPALNTAIHMSPKISAATYFQSFTGNITANNLAANCNNYNDCLGNASISINSSQAQTFTFIPGTVRWYPDAPVSNQEVTFSSNQEQALFSPAGLVIGTIATNVNCPQSQQFCHQGTVVAQYQVSNNQPQASCAINSFTANPSNNIPYNSTSALSWTTTGTSNVTLSGVSGTFGTNSSYQTGPLTQFTSYTMTAHCQDGSTRTRSVSISVAQQPACNATFSASNTFINAGQSTTLTWTTNNATSVTLSPSNGTHPGVNDYVTVSPTSTTTYTLTVHCNNGTTIIKTVVINVTQPQTPVCTITNFSANNGWVTYGGSTNLLWQTTNCTSVNISTIGSVTPVGAGSHSTGALNQTTTFTISASNATSTAIPRNYTINVGTSPTCSINSFSASSYLIPYNSPTNLLWSTTNCTSASITSIGSVTVNGSAPTGNLIGQTVYTLTALGANGSSDTKNVTINTTQQGNQGYCTINSFNATPNPVVSGNTTTLSWSTSNNCTDVSISNIGQVATSGSTQSGPITGMTVFTLSASVNGGAVQVRTITVNIANNNNGGGQQTYACNNGTDDDGDGLVDMQDPGCSYPQDNSEYNFVQPQTYYACNNGADDDNDGLVDMSDPGCSYPQDNDEYNYVQPPVQNLAVSTLVASGIGSTQATLNGYVTGGYSGNNTVYFQWGPTYSLGYTTSSQTATNGAFSLTINTLSPNTTYYYRAVAQNNGTTVYGNILSFSTISASPTNPVIIYTGGGSGGGVPLMTLKIETRFETVSAGDTIDYTVTYKNVANRTTLKNVVVHIQFPENVIFGQSTRGEFSAPDNTLTLNVGSMSPQQEDSFFVQGKVSLKAKNGDLLVTSGNVSYVTPANTQGDVVAYAMNNVSNDANSFLAGLALFGADGIFPNTLAGWLLLILVIFLVVMLGRRAFAPAPVSRMPTAPMPH